MNTTRRTINIIVNHKTRKENFVRAFFWLEDAACRWQVGVCIKKYVCSSGYNVLHYYSTVDQHFQTQDYTVKLQCS